MAARRTKRSHPKRRPLTTSVTGELAFTRLLQSLTGRLDKIRDEPGKLRHGLRAAMQCFDAPEGCVAILKPPSEEAVVGFDVPQGGLWDAGALTTFVAGGYPDVPANVIGAAVPRRERPWTAFVLRKPSGVFRPGDGRALARITAAVAQSVRQLDQHRILEVRDRLDRKIMEQLRPRDLFYQLLHGLRSLLRYDHSSALLISDDEGATLKLIAEQLACIKGKSRSIGRRFKLDDPLRELLDSSQIYGFERCGERWKAWDDNGDSTIAELLDYNCAAERESSLPREQTMICAPIATRSGVIGVLKVSATLPGTLGPAEADILRVFKSQASVAIQYLQGTETLRKQILDVERKQAMANVARGISHDINNALGSVLPLVQQLRAEVGSDQIVPDTLAGDLAQIERSLQASRRIFGGVLSLTRSTAPSVGEGNVRRALDNAIDILAERMKRRGIAIELQVADDLPSVRLRHSDLAQVFLNIASNAQDAMAAGGTLSVRAAQHDGGVEVEMCDTGCGIAAHEVRRIEEPFFTTKSDGNGLGLAICRSILSEAQAKMHISSTPGAGTAVRLLLPASVRLQEAQP